MRLLPPSLTSPPPPQPPSACREESSTQPTLLGFLHPARRPGKRKIRGEGADVLMLHTATPKASAPNRRGGVGMAKKFAPGSKGPTTNHQSQIPQPPPRISCPKTKVNGDVPAQRQAPSSRRGSGTHQKRGRERMRPSGWGRGMLQAFQTESRANRGREICEVVFTYIEKNNWEKKGSVSSLGYIFLPI